MYILVVKFNFPLVFHLYINYNSSRNDKTRGNCMKETQLNYEEYNVVAVLSDSVLNSTSGHYYRILEMFKMGEWDLCSSEIRSLTEQLGLIAGCCEILKNRIGNKI